MENEKAQVAAIAWRPSAKGDELILKVQEAIDRINAMVIAATEVAGDR